MVDRVAADNPSVETVRATLARAGRTDRPKIELPEAFPVPDGPVRLVLDGQECHAVVDLSLDETLEIRGVYGSVVEARAGEDSDRLVDWVDDRDLGFGRSVLVDVVQVGHHYGLRAPGEHAVYETRERDEGLAAIAEDVAEREGR